MKQKLNLKWLKYLLSKHILAFIFVNFIVSLSLYAQERTITGTVRDNTGETLVGVNIFIKGTTLGTASGIDGTYSLKVMDNSSVLVANYIGYKSQEIPVGGQSIINITLDKDVLGIDEVVVVGYGVQKKKLVTGATVQVKNEEFTKNNSVRIENALQGLTPGMSIVKQSGQPGSDYNITIRGLSSINGNTPLILIDGVPGSLNMINPSDIESIDVLKDAASAAIYGSRAANGVILVTTKKGKAGEAQITYDAYYGISNVSKKIDLLNAEEYMTIMNEASYNSKPKRLVPYTQDYIDQFVRNNGEGTDWLEAGLNENAPSMSHYLGITGGNEKSTYSVSISYNTEEGIYNYNDKSKYQRLGFRVNSEHKVKDYLIIGENLTYTHRVSTAMSTGNMYNNFLHDMMSASPLIKVYDENIYDGFGRGKAVDANGQNGDVDAQGNPIASLHYKYNGVNNYDDIIGNIYAEISILPGLKFRTDFGATLGFNNFTDHRDTFNITVYDFNIKPDYEQSMSRTFNYNFDNVLSFEKDFGKQHILAILGMNAQDGTYFNMRSKREGFLMNVAPVLSNVMSDSLITSYIIEGDFGEGDSRFSYFGRVSWDMDEKYMATVSLRRDGSSRFGKNNRYGYFPSISAGWVISNEDFMKSATWVDFLKLRASWGQNGKEPAERFVYMARVGTTDRSYYFGDALYTGVSPIIFANPDLKWEASTQTNIGFDARFLENFRVAFDWYQKFSKDWIMQSPVAGLSGIAGISQSNPFINGGNVKNSGLEFDLGYSKNFGDLVLDIGANLAYNKNIVTEVPDSIIHGSSSVLYNGCSEFYQIREGMPMGYFFGFRTAGIFQTQEEIESYVNSAGTPYHSVKATKPGDVKRIDENKDDKITDADKVMLGDPNPDFIFGLRLNAEYKGFDISVNLQGVAGNQIVQSYRAQEQYYYNYSTDILDRWQWKDGNNNGLIDAGEGTSNKIPRVTLSDESNQNWRKFGDLYIHNGDYLKIKSVNIGYDLKKSLFKNTPIQKFRLYVSATNLFTFTNYSGMDPEIGYGAYYDSEGRLTDAYASGIDVGFYPSARTYIFGVNVTF
jgi:TonB-linked SusC/RagA family outer membrane protein